jgi:SAM-dependent methyltransferase
VKYPLFRKENIEALNRAIREDEFDDLAKHRLMGYVYPPDYIEFIERNLLEGPTADIGCGSGASFSLLPITHALEANPQRHLLASAAAAKNNVRCHLGAAECLPWEPGSLTNILHLQGFFQVRSDWEALIEYNRALALGGRFIFDLPSEGRPVVFGRNLEVRSYVKILGDYGFEPVEVRRLDEHFGFTAVCVEKTEEWHYSKMKKVQLVPSEEHEGLYLARNLDPNDWTLR